MKYANINRYTDTLCDYHLFPHIVCGAALTPSQKEYCEKNKSKFDNHYLCFIHQRQYQPTGSASVVPSSDIEKEEE